MITLCYCGCVYYGLRGIRNGNVQIFWNMMNTSIYLYELSIYLNMCAPHHLDILSSHLCKCMCSLFVQRCVLLMSLNMRDLYVPNLCAPRLHKYVCTSST